jgi:hypothetical protein
MSQFPTSTRFAGPGSLAMLVAAVAGAVGIVFVLLMFASFAVGAKPAGMAFGWINDVAVLLQYLLAVPGVLAIGAALRPVSPALARFGTALAIAGIAVIVVFQGLLVAGAMTFEQEIGPASAGFLVLGVWLVAAAVVGRRSGRVPVSPAVAVAAALYMGFPLWAYRVGRWMDAVPSARSAERAAAVSEAG